MLIADDAYPNGFKSWPNGCLIVLFSTYQQILNGVMVSILACHVRDWGSIPHRGSNILLCSCFQFGTFILYQKSIRYNCKTDIITFYEKSCLFK